MNHWPRILLFPVFLLALARAALAATPPTAENVFAQQVRPLLENKCFQCHGAEKQKGRLRLDSRAAILKGGETGPAIIPGDAAKSLLLQAVRHATKDLAMPPKEKLADKDIAALEAWVKEGAPWPETVAVLFEDEEEFLAVFTNGNGRARLVTDDVFAGKAALGMTPLQREAPKIPGWNFEIREVPQPGQFRFLRFAWKKRGGGSVMFELARSGQWPDAKAAKGRYVAGPNATGWAAISVADTAPTAWTVVTVDLWNDLGNCTLTGLAPTCDKGEEAFFDSVILSPDRASLDAYVPGNGRFALKLATPAKPLGDAWTDPENPIRKIWRGERLDLWSLKKPVRPAVPPIANRQSPIRTPIRVPMRRSIQSPIQSPTPRPIQSPTRWLTQSPTRRPIRTPTQRPIRSTRSSSRSSPRRTSPSRPRPSARR